MEITRYIRADQPDKKGQVFIHYTICYDGVRVRMSSKQKILAANWDPKKETVTSNQKFYLDIRSKLTDLDKAISDVYAEANKANLVLQEREFKAEVEKIVFPNKTPRKSKLDPALVPEPTPEPVPEPELDFFGLFEQFIHQHRRKISHYTNKPVKASTITSYQNTLNRLKDFVAFRLEEGEVLELKLEKMDKSFYTSFRDYIMMDLDQDVDTFSKHIRRLKTFLKDCDEEMELPVSRKYKQFETPTKDAVIEPLTEEELESIKAIDFTQTSILAFVLESFLKEKSSSGSDPHKVKQRIETLEKMRDAFLFICYTGIRVSDAFQINQSHIHGDLLIFMAQKTNEECLVPYYNDGLFRPVEIVEKYKGQQDTLLPVNRHINKYLKYIQQLAGISRLNLTTKIGRKTFVTLKIYQGVPTRLIMQATGHQTEEAFNAYAGVDRKSLVAGFKSKSVATKN